ncbi:DNA polymerase III subunit [Rhizosphaericola mali]|uniref:DNA polymerase III subunit delta n=1 Tax=Rhizosphaericola mali TaxID=2545455 RepID=A0A5P2GFZ8_9BACT|nr:DNA polymerase III subunit delta' [Rhizosphaericola mali]QES90591.1 hypothetical protein E0W69_018670 [Rhizosphaericola mali]
MQFKDVIGQATVKQHLVELVQQNRLSHALLFLGKEGSGALSLAIAFAQYVLCEKASGKSESDLGPSMFGDLEPAPAMNDSCGQCRSCVKAEQYIHPDIHFSYPVIPRKPGDKPTSTDYITQWREFLKESPYGNAYDWLLSIKAENKQGNITAEECNSIIHKLSLKSFESEYKILIMWMPEYLQNSGNKLLKLIEEPPAKTLFILVAENADNILPTILSRCQLIKIPALEREDIEAALQTNGYEGERASLAASMADGNYRVALLEAENAEDNDWQAILREWLNVAFHGNPINYTKWVDTISKYGREPQKQFIYFFIHLLEQALRLKVLGANAETPTSELDFAQRLNKLLTIEQQEAIMSELDKAAYYIERNANPKLLFHALTIKLNHIIKDKALILAQ